jgi:hypothetical protein
MSSNDEEKTPEIVLSGLQQSLSESDVITGSRVIDMSSQENLRPSQQKDLGTIPTSARYYREIVRVKPRGEHLLSIEMDKLRRNEKKTNSNSFRD